MMEIKKAYLGLIEKFRVNPNFFISWTYLSQERFTGRVNDGWYEIVDDDGSLFLPPIHPDKGLPQIHNSKGLNWQVGFCNSIETKEFFDYNYIYDPKSFFDLKGGEWSTFRKNIRKFPKRCGYLYTSHCDTRQVQTLLVEWLERNKESVHDAEFLIDCIMLPNKGDYIKYLYDNKGKLHAINYADYNYKYINYRFIISDRFEFSDEFARYCFYTDQDIINTGRYVNDGGCLGYENLEKFKDKLNPIYKYKIYSLKK